MVGKQRSMAKHSGVTKNVSKSLFFTSMAIVAVVAFALGTRSNDIMAVVGPVFGIKVPHGQIDLSSIEKTYQQLNGNFDGKLDTQALINGANQGLVAAAGDKFTVYLDAKDAQSFSNGLSGNVGSGIGVAIATRNNLPTIVEILPDNPAARAGIQTDDAITAIDGTSVSGWSVDKVAAAVRGNAGTTVKLTVSRNGTEQDYTLTRATINDPSVISKVEGGIGIMTITRFDENTGNLARQAVQSFKNQNVKGVVVDLRDNGGGYVDAAQSVASLWLSNKTVVIEKTGGQVTNTVSSDDNPVLNGVPTVILVNGNTASASEIVSGALQDYGIAKLVGTKTYGKGTMQQVIDLGSGNALKVTIAHWYTPKGRTINGTGLIPDQSVSITSDQINSGQDPQMDAAMADL